MSRPVPGSRCVFIVGFERCMTSSLAAYLVDQGYCSLLVDGIKEPSVFSSDPSLAEAILRSRVARHAGWYLDASVNYVTSPMALAAIRAKVEHYRIIVCMRNQFQRTISAFQLYHGILTQPAATARWQDWPLSLQFGDNALRARAASDPLAPPVLREAPLGNYVYTAIAAFAAGISGNDETRLRSYDRAVEEFRAQSFPERVVNEFRSLRRTGEFPLISLLKNSYFAWCIEQVLTHFDHRRVLFTTLQGAGIDDRLDPTLERFLSIRPRKTGALPHVLASGQFGVTVGERDEALGNQLLDASLIQDSERTVALLKSEGDLDLTLFSQHALYPQARCRRARISA